MVKALICGRITYRVYIIIIIIIFGLVELDEYFTKLRWLAHH